MTEPLVEVTDLTVEFPVGGPGSTYGPWAGSPSPWKRAARWAS